MNITDIKRGDTISLRAPKWPAYEHLKKFKHQYIEEYIGFYWVYVSGGDGLMKKYIELKTKNFNLIHISPEKREIYTCRMVLIEKRIKYI